MILAASPSSPSTTLIVGLGVVVFVAAVSVFGVSLGLRGRTFKRLADDVDIAFSGLAERAREQLKSLQEELNSVLPDPTEPFDPFDVIFDPGRLEVPARDGLRIIRRQRRIRTQFQSLLRVCSIAKYLSGTFVLFCALATLSYWLWFGAPSAWILLTAAAVVNLVLGALLVGFYAYLNTQVEASIERARPNPGLGGGGS